MCYVELCLYGIYKFTISSGLCIIFGSNYRCLVCICSLLVIDNVYICCWYHHENYHSSRKQVLDFLITYSSVISIDSITHLG